MNHRAKPRQTCQDICGKIDSSHFEVGVDEERMSEYQEAFDIAREYVMSLWWYSCGPFPKEKTNSF